jgi:hypothetical protein
VEQAGEEKTERQGVWSTNGWTDGLHARFPKNRDASQKKETIRLNDVKKKVCLFLDVDIKRKKKHVLVWVRGERSSLLFCFKKSVV